MENKLIKRKSTTKAFKEIYDSLTDKTISDINKASELVNDLIEKTIAFSIRANIIIY